MEKLEIAMKALDKADDVVKETGELLGILKQAHIPKHLEVKVATKLVDFASSLSAYKTLRQLTK